MENWNDVNKRMKSDIKNLIIGTYVLLVILFIVFKTIEWIF